MRYTLIADSALTEPPMLEHLLFEQPWVLVYGLLGIAFIFATKGIRRRTARPVIVAAVMACAGAMVYAISWYVVTDREQMIALTRQAIQCTVMDPIDTEGLKGLVAPDASIFGPDDKRWLSYDQCLMRLASVAQSNPIREQTITAIQAQTTGPDSGLTRIDLRTIFYMEIRDRPLMTRWLLTWSHTPESGWMVNKIQWLEHPGLNSINPQTVIRR